MKIRWVMESVYLVLEIDGRLVGSLYLSGGTERHAYFNFYENLVARHYKIRATTQAGAKREAMRIAARRYRREAEILRRRAGALSKAAEVLKAAGRSKERT